MAVSKIVSAYISRTLLEDCVAMGKAQAAACCVLVALSVAVQWCEGAPESLMDASDVFGMLDEPERSLKTAMPAETLTSPAVVERKGGAGAPTPEC